MSMQPPSQGTKCPTYVPVRSAFAIAARALRWGPRSLEPAHLANNAPASDRAREGRAARDALGDVRRIGTDAAKQRGGDGVLKAKSHEVEAVDIQRRAAAMTRQSLHVERGQLDPRVVGRE